MTENNETTFEFEDKTYKVKQPTNKVRRESEKIYAAAYREALLNNFLLDAEIDEILEERGFTSKATNQKRDKLAQNIRQLEVRLVKEDYKNLEEGKEIAFQVQDLRSDLMTIDSARTQLQSQSVERQAENKRFNFFAYKCVTDGDDQPLWGSFDEFEADDTPLAVRSATELLLLLYGVQTKSQKEIMANRTEIRWLKANGFMNDDLQLINDNDQLVDRNGRLINEDGEFIDDNGDRIDKFGNRIDENGNLLFESDVATNNSPKKKTRKKKVDTSEKEEEVSLPN